MALRLRRSTFMADFFTQQGVEEAELATIMNQFLGKPPEK
jgi:hypothetical protein